MWKYLESKPRLEALFLRHVAVGGDLNLHINAALWWGRRCTADRSLLDEHSCHLERKINTRRHKCGPHVSERLGSV